MAQSAQIQKLSPKHEAILVALVSDPSMSRNQLAMEIGVSPAWLSTIINSDVFQAALKERQEEVWGRAAEGIANKLSLLAEKSLDRLTSKVDVENNPEILLDITKAALNRTGFPDARSSMPGGPALQQNNFFSVSPEQLSVMREKVIERGTQVEQSNAALPADSHSEAAGLGTTLEGHAEVVQAETSAGSEGEGSEV